MAASASDYFKKVGLPGNATTLAAPGHVIGGTSFTVDSTSLWSTDTGVTFAIDKVDGTGARIANTYTVWDGVVSSATTITGAVLRYGTDQDYAAGSTTRVYILPTSTRENKFVDGILVAHEQTGIHKSGASYPDPVFSGTATGTYTLGGTPTIASPVLSGSVTGTYTLAGTPTINSPTNTGTHSGWVTGLTAPNTVTALGNRSYSLVINSTDLTGIVSAGMRLRTTRTSAAPTQCTSLNGTTQYYNKASPTGISFTTTWTVSAWVKLSSYATGVIISRNNGTTDGWYCYVDSSGRLAIAGTRAADDTAISYQSIPLNKWVHVAATMDTAGAASTMYFDGASVPVSFTNNANAAIVQGTSDLRIGASSGISNYFPGKIAQVALFSAVISQANILSYMSQGLAGNETSCVGAWSFNNSINDLNANANNLTPNGSAVATNADSPFGGQAGGSISTTLDYGIVTAASFSTNTTLTVQVPEGCTIPTSGGVTSLAYSTQKCPYGMPTGLNKWKINSLLRTNNPTTSNATYGAFSSGGWALTVPIGEWIVGHQEGCILNATTTSVYYNISSTALTGLSATAGQDASPFGVHTLSPSAANVSIAAHARQPQSLAAQVTYVMYTLGATTSSQVQGTISLCEIYAECAYL